MRTRANISVLSAKRAGGFTMVEIAIALGVIAFALIAIIGILPAGLQTQRDTREETIVSQDGRVLIEAIKAGGRDFYSDIGAHVVKVDNDPTDYSVSTGPLSFGKPPPGIWTSNLVQLLSDPDPNGHVIVLSAIGGAIATRGSDLGFRYQVTSHVHVPPEFTNSPTAGDPTVPSSPLYSQVYEVRLRFAWPVNANGTVGAEANRYVVRSLISGTYKNGFLYAQHYWNANYTNAP